MDDDGNPEEKLFVVRDCADDLPDESGEIEVFFGNLPYLPAQFLLLRFRKLYETEQIRRDFVANISHQHYLVTSDREGNFEVEPVADGRPRAAATFGMYLDHRWYRLRAKAGSYPAGDPVRSLDVAILQDNLLGPVLGIKDLRRDKRIDFVGGIRGLEELERRVDSGEMAAAFALHATDMEDLMSVADAGEVMPPKSTWFEPKLADGLVSHVLD